MAGAHPSSPEFCSKSYRKGISIYFLYTVGCYFFRLNSQVCADQDTSMLCVCQVAIVAPLELDLFLAH